MWAGFRALAQRLAGDHGYGIQDAETTGNSCATLRSDPSRSLVVITTSAPYDGFQNHRRSVRVRIKFASLLLENKLLRD